MNTSLGFIWFSFIFDAVCVSAKSRNHTKKHRPASAEQLVQLSRLMCGTCSLALVHINQG